MQSIRQLYSAEQIRLRVAELGKEISEDYQGIERPVFIGVMKGAFCFFADLIRQIQGLGPVQVEFVRLASYGGGTESSGEVQAPYLDLPNIKGRHILVVEDIVDSGRTARFFTDYLQAQFQPASLKLISFLDKPSKRVVDVKPDYVGYSLADLFVVGYGLDYGENFRELPYLGELVGVEVQ